MPDEDIAVSFENVYDGHEQESVYKDDMKLVPCDNSNLSSWMAVITYFNEEEERGRIFADVVYISNPQVRVTVRVKAMVKGLSFGTPR